MGQVQAVGQRKAAPGFGFAPESARADSVAVQINPDQRSAIRGGPQGITEGPFEILPQVVGDQVAPTAPEDGEVALASGGAMESRAVLPVEGACGGRNQQTPALLREPQRQILDRHSLGGSGHRSRRLTARHRAGTR